MHAWIHGWINACIGAWVHAFMCMNGTRGWERGREGE